MREATSGLTRPRLLDCGCGTGTNLTFLQQFGVPFGVDLTWRGLQFAHRKGLPRLAQATVAALPFVDGSFDLAVSFDVLYCLEDAAERQAIAEMHRVLRPGGALVVNAARSNLLKGDHSVLVSELRRYTRAGLTSKLQRAGFRVERITYTNAALFPVTAGIRALQRLRGLKPEGGPRGDSPCRRACKCAVRRRTRTRSEAGRDRHQHADRKFTALPRAKDLGAMHADSQALRWRL